MPGIYAEKTLKQLENMLKKSKEDYKKNGGHKSTLAKINSIVKEMDRKIAKLEKEIDDTLHMVESD